MEANLGRTRNLGSGIAETYEISCVLDLRHLADLTKNYLAVYGEELSDYKLNKLVIDLLYGLLTKCHSTDNHRWMRKFFNEGLEFIELFEKEASITLSSNFPLWREYESNEIHLTVENNLSSTFLGFKTMFPNVNRKLMTTHNGMDSYVNQRMNALFEQEVLLDFSNTMAYAVCEQELRLLSHGRITWAYLIEESTRLSMIMRNQGIYPSKMSGSMLASLLDKEELKARFENSDTMNRLVTTEDVVAADRIFENIQLDLADLISRILFSNCETLTMIADQLFNRAKAMGYEGMVSFHCFEFQWLNRAGIAKFGAYPVI